MNNKISFHILKIVEALIGGVVLLLGVYYLASFVNHTFPPQHNAWFGPSIFVIILGFPVSIFMVFVFYYLLTKNKVLVNENGSVVQELQKPAGKAKWQLIILGISTTIIYFSILSNFSSIFDPFIAGLYGIGCVFFIPFVLTRPWSISRKITWVIILFIVGSLFASIDHL